MRDVIYGTAVYTLVCVPGMLHTQFGKPRHRLFRRALAMRAFFCAAHIPRASEAAQATLTVATLWRVPQSLVCVTAPTDGRSAICAAQKFPQENGLERRGGEGRMPDPLPLCPYPPRDSHTVCWFALETSL